MTCRAEREQPSRLRVSFQPSSSHGLFIGTADGFRCSIDEAREHRRRGTRAKPQRRKGRRGWGIEDLRFSSLCSLCVLCGEIVSSSIEATGVSLLLSFNLLRVHPRASVVLFILLDGLAINAPPRFDCIDHMDLSDSRFPHFLAIHAQSGQRPLLRIFSASLCGLCGSAVNSSWKQREGNPGRNFPHFAVERDFPLLPPAPVPTQGATNHGTTIEKDH